MGTVYKKTATKPLPAGAELLTKHGERFARWKPSKGKTRTAPVTTGRDGTERIVVTAGTYLAKYRDGDAGQDPVVQLNSHRTSSYRKEKGRGQG